MRISLAICTFNGETHLPDQLASIASQVRPPDEIVISDDCSTDGTLEIIQKFADSADCPVLINKAKSRSGSTANFESAIRRCSGDIIILSDQDDVWLPNRIDAVESAFRRSPESTMFFANARMMNAHSVETGSTLWENLGLTPALQSGFHSGRGFNLLLRRNLVTGATMAFRSDMREKFLPIPRLWVHDAWIALICCFYGEVSLSEEHLILYRQHDNQQLGATRKSLAAGLRSVAKRYQSYYEEDVVRFELLRDRLCVSATSGRNQHTEDLIRKIAFCRDRLAYSSGGCLSLYRIFRDFCGTRYLKYANGWRGAAVDAAVVVRYTVGDF